MANVEARRDARPASTIQIAPRPGFYAGHDPHPKSLVALASPAYSILILDNTPEAAWSWSPFI